MADERRSALSAEDIRAHWTAQAEQHGQHPASSWSDWRAIELEIEAISRRLGPGLDVLDAGCATGYSSARFAALGDLRVTGVDYVPAMVEHALERRASLPADVAARLDFRVDDVRGLEFADASFDRVVSTRVVINLGEWPEQRRALGELARVLRPGGLVLLSEATTQGSDRLNALRSEWGLPPIPEPSFNVYLDEDALTAAVPALGLDLEAVENFASSYYVATRLVKPLLAAAAGTAVDVADPDAEFNRWASQLPAAGDYGTQKLFVLRRRG